MGSHAMQDTCKCCLKEAVMYWIQGWAQETQSWLFGIQDFKCNKSLRYRELYLKVYLSVEMNFAPFLNSGSNEGCSCWLLKGIVSQSVFLSFFLSGSSAEIMRLISQAVLYVLWSLFANVLLSRTSQRQREDVSTGYSCLECLLDYKGHSRGRSLAGCNQCIIFIHRGGVPLW